MGLSFHREGPFCPNTTISWPGQQPGIRGHWGVTAGDGSSLFGRLARLACYYGAAVTLRHPCFLFSLICSSIGHSDPCHRD
jgi:hypothetical protein